MFLESNPRKTLTSCAFTRFVRNIVRAFMRWGAELHEASGVLQMPGTQPGSACEASTLNVRVQGGGLWRHTEASYAPVGCCLKALYLDGKASPYGGGSSIINSIQASCRVRSP